MSASGRGPVRRARIGGAVVAAAGMVGAGALAGGVWWLAAGAGVLAAIGAVFDHKLGLVQVLVVLGLVIALATTEQLWFVPVVLATTIASFELAAAADRTSAIRPVVRFTDIAPAVLGGAALAGVVLVLGEVTRGGPTFAVVGAAIAATVAVRVLAR